MDVGRISYFTRDGVKTLPLREHGNMFPSDVEGLKLGALDFHRDVAKLSCCAE